jgi:hypothetical protein
VPVKASFDGLPYTGAFVKYGRPQHMLPILKNIRAKVGTGPEDPVEVIIERDKSIGTVDVPAKFAVLLNEEKLLRVFEKLSYTHRSPRLRRN